MRHSDHSQETVVLVHGLYMGAWAVGLLGYRLARRHGWRTYRFSYPTARTPLETSIEHLQRAIGELDTGVVHLVGHSLGGLLIRYLFDRYPSQAPGRVVTLGTPHVASHVCMKLAARRWSRWILGRSSPEALLGNAPPWRGSHELGVIAGTLGVGIGRLAPKLPRPNDGTVAVEETRLPNAADWIALPVTHTSMLVSSAVAEQVATFLDQGRFLNAARGEME